MPRVSEMQKSRSKIYDRIPTQRESHDVEDAIQLVVVVGIASLYVLLPAVENGLRGEEFSKDAANCPNICSRELSTTP